ncbi:hypothetical protein TGAM01_v206324 [Trichoderma gamsii]|uniref:Uncharacterized protein n=1 Tax=Trichoderma gamsii TaxID=398673 RepID=A0A2P4ZKM1_9HYPO|nr:hypothetical protein TGAM01_v206324 [Trichoderma gamsii]PON24816.1 hypothetical protein TGAM01_v206324 [Trichoderma gamsii]
MLSAATIGIGYAAANIGDALWCLDRRQGKADEQKRDQARPEDLRYTGTAPFPAGHALLATAYACTFSKNSAVLALGNPPRTHTSFEHEERVCEVGGSTGVAQLGFSWPRLWLSLSQSQLAWSIWAGRATDQRAGLDEWMEQASFPEPVSAEGQAKHPDSCGLGEATPEELPRPLAARLVSSEASLSPRLGRKSATRLTRAALEEGICWGIHCLDSAVNSWPLHVRRRSPILAMPKAMPISAPVRRSPARGISRILRSPTWHTVRQSAIDASTISRTASNRWIDISNNAHLRFPLPGPARPTPADVKTIPAP